MIEWEYMLKYKDEWNVRLFVASAVFSIQNYNYAFFLVSTCIKKVVSMNPLQKNDYFYPFFLNANSYWSFLRDGLLV